MAFPSPTVVEGRPLLPVRVLVAGLRDEVVPHVHVHARAARDETVPWRRAAVVLRIPRPLLLFLQQRTTSAGITSNLVERRAHPASGSTARSTRLTLDGLPGITGGPPGKPSFFDELPWSGFLLLWLPYTSLRFPPLFEHIGQSTTSTQQSRRRMSTCYCATTLMRCTAEASKPIP